MLPYSQYLKQIAKFLNVPITNLTDAPDGVTTCTVKKKSVSGVLNIVFELLTEAKSNLGGRNNLEKLQICQWLEYALVYGVHCDRVHNIQQVLSELNTVLATRTFIATNKLSIADVFIYYVLYDLFDSLAYLEKEKFINASRWFDNIQQNENIRQSKKLIDFRSNFLVNLAPARHF